MTRKLGMYVAPALLILTAATAPPASAAAASARGLVPQACTSWAHTKSPNTGTGDNDLFGIAATSAHDAWAVGEYFVGVNTRTLIEHWNGKSWRIVHSPNAGATNSLAAYARTLALSLTLMSLISPPLLI